MHLLYETATGYFILKIRKVEDIGKKLKEVQSDIIKLENFGKEVKIISFKPFKDSKEALKNIEALNNGILPLELKELIQKTIPKDKKSIELGVIDKNLSIAIKKDLQIKTRTDELVEEIVRGVRFHESKILKDFFKSKEELARFGLGHAYSSENVKFSQFRSDNMIIHAISTCDQLLKDLNQTAMRIREWYGWHFPELYSHVPNEEEYTKATLILENSKDINNEKIENLKDLLGEEITEKVLKSAKTSMGISLTDGDFLIIKKLAMIHLKNLDYFNDLLKYLNERMEKIAPNLTALVGDSIGARLISRAGSLSNLSKLPASTIQILGAEKALFRALKAKAKTPKYGLIYNSSFIGRSSIRNKGKISRFLANKCAIASRIDSFSESSQLDSEYGQALKTLIDERIQLYEAGKKPVISERIIQEISQKKAKINNQDSKLDSNLNNLKLKIPSKKLKESDELENENGLSKKEKKKKTKKLNSKKKDIIKKKEAVIKKKKEKELKKSKASKLEPIKKILVKKSNKVNDAEIKSINKKETKRKKKLRESH